MTDQLVKVEMQSEVLKDTLDELNDANDIGRPHEIALETQEQLILEKERGTYVTYPSGPKSLLTDCCREGYCVEHNINNHIKNSLNNE